MLINDSNFLPPLDKEKITKPNVIPKIILMSFLGNCSVI